jgi:glutamyl-tRNA synthetase
VTETAPLVASIDFGRFGRAPARFDEAELAHLNARILHQTGFAAVADRLPAGIDQAGWEAIRPNLTRIGEAADWWSVVEGPVTATMADQDRDFLDQAAIVAEALDWAGDPWHALTNALKASTGRKGKPLFLPLRLALTGREHGPDMAALLPLIGKGRAVARLRV